MVGLQHVPASNAAAVRKSSKSRTQNAKSVIVGCLGDSAMAKTGAIIDDDEKTAYDLWKAPEKISTETSTKGLPSLNSDLDRIQYGEKEVFDKFFSKFLVITGQLAALDRPLSDADQVTNIIRVFPESFAPLTMVASPVDIPFNRLSAAV